MKNLTDLHAKDILRSLDDLNASGKYRDSPYGVWFHGKHISPARVIERAYELIGEPVERTSELNTDPAQKRLLDLGFPIVQKASDGFFTAKELLSFSRLVTRKTYNQNNPVDSNIGEFLNQVPWEKTRIWAKKLEDLGWVMKGGKNWNQRSGQGQRIKDYTWYRLYPRERLNDLICFTVGIHSNGELVYKLHNMFADEAFKGERGELFNKLYRERELDDWQEISIATLGDYDWDSLVEKSHKYFTKHLSDYKELSDAVFKNYDRRIMRLTWNKNGWEKPSGHSWREKDQGNTSIAFENQYGYGHEEWLFNHRYQKDGFQYGFVRGVDNMSEQAETIDELVLYTINPADRGRYLVAKIRDVTIIEGTEEVDEIAIPLFETYMEEVLSELEEVGADFESFRSDNLVPNIKFTLQNVTIFNDPIPAPYLNGPEFNRFQAYRIDEDLHSKLDREIKESYHLNFNSGKASTSDSYNKKTSAKETKVTRSHSQITNDLYDYFHLIKGVSEDHLSAEKTRVGGAIVDFALEEKGGLVLFEAKTSSSGLQNIRQALGQLLEYAFLDESAKIKKLVIVGPAELKEYEIGYLNRIREMLNVPLDYWAYLKENKLAERFLVI